MKRSIEALVMFEMVAVIVAMAIAGLCGVARAEPAQQFSLQVMNPTPGDMRVRLTLRMYDTTGAVPPSPTVSEIRLARGVGLNRAFLGGGWFCDGPALRDALDAHPSGVPFTRRIQDLKPFIRELARSHAKRDRVTLANARACERGRLGGGTGLIDARTAVPVLVDPIPVKFTEFLSRGTVPGAIAGFAILGAADERAPIVRRYPVVAGVHAAIVDNLVSDPTPDGLYGNKLAFDTGPVNGFEISIAQVETTVGLQLRKGTCLRREAGGRCARRQPVDAALFVVPACPLSGHFSAQMFSAYPPPVPSLTTTLELPCPRYAS